MSGRAGRKYRLRKRRRRGWHLLETVLRDYQNMLEAIDILVTRDGQAEVEVKTMTARSRSRP